MKVYVVGKDFTSECTLVANMFASAGWKVVDDDSYGQSPIHLVCFVGGADVNPALYGEENESSYIDEKRDEFEKEVYERYLEKGVPMVGICRGGQFLNVMNGGKMIQHITGHSSSIHDCMVLAGGQFGGISEVWPLQEDHHQGILPPNFDRAKHPVGQGPVDYTVLGWDANDLNVEIVYFDNTKCLCFQPHPEWGHGPTKKLFFGLIEEYLNLKGE